MKVALALGGLSCKPINAHNGQKLSDNFDEVLQAKEKLGLHLKKKCYSKYYQQIAIIDFVKSFLIPKLSSKILYNQMTISRGTLKHE